jgi:hypothetical protein
MTAIRRATEIEMTNKRKLTLLPGAADGCFGTWLFEKDSFFTYF